MEIMLIHLEKLGKSFGEKLVLRDVTASVEREDRIGIVGQNGAGKTTLLKILTEEYTDYDGEFSVTHGVTLGYLEQNAKLDVTLDIYGEMRSCFAPVLEAMARMQILERKMAAESNQTQLLAQHEELQSIIDAADGYQMDVNIKKVLSGMGFAQDTWGKNVGVLSGGELTRLRLAKLLLEKPDVLILDEPTAGLDPRGRDVLLAQITQYHKARGNTVLLVSHSMEDIGRTADRILVMNHSHAAMLDDTKKVFARGEELEQMGLRVPQITKILQELQKMGLPVDSSTLTVDDALHQLIPILKRKEELR